jgi:hypothetical protein
MILLCINSALTSVELRATAMILAGAMLEHERLGASMLFLLCWTTFFYYILAVGLSSASNAVITISRCVPNLPLLQVV